MIPASEALQLPSAKLTDDEIAGVAKLLADIETHLLKSMTFRGIQMEGKETRENVVSAADQHLVAAGYNTQWQFVVQKHPLNAALTQTIGYKLAMMPRPEFYAAMLTKPSLSAA